MKRQRRTMLFAAAMLLLGAGCTRVVRVPTAELLAQPEAKMHTVSGQSIAGYTDSIGGVHEYSGKVRAFQSDSIVFYRERPDLGRVKNSMLLIETRRDFAAVPAAVPRLHVHKFSALKTSALVLSPFALIIVLFAIGGGYSVGS